MNKLLIALALICAPVATLYATEPADSAYIAFRQARGEASWIASAADHPLADSAFRPIPSLGSFPTNPAKSQLGFALFHDARLSSTNSVACSSCHMGMLGGTDRVPVSRGIGGRLGTMNAPTVFNSAFNFRQFWDGRALTLDEQALAPLSNPLEMGHDLQAVVDFVASDPNYSRQFETIYPDGVTAANIGNAIAQHTRDMTRTDSRFNAYLRGDESALSKQEQRGWERFQALGCASCHNGINLGGNSYQSITSNMDFFASRTTNAADDGIYTRSSREKDRHVFKVPTLNNVALTAPYYHDGSVATLREAVDLMAQTQAGRGLSDPDAEDIVAFLHSLSSDFFATHGPGMNHEAMQGEMQHRMRMNHQGHHGAMSGHGGVSADSSGDSEMTMPMGQHGRNETIHGQHHMMMSSPMGFPAQQGQHGGHTQ